MASPNYTQVFPFSNKGLVQKLDINLLADDQYAFLLNMVSVQEGAMKVRRGWKQLATTWGGAQPAYVHSINVAKDNPFGYLYTYLGTGTDIYRNIYNGTTSLSSDIILGPATSAPYRCSYPIWKYNDSGQDFMAYFATGGSKTGRDNGSYGYARCWGIDPPVDYARCAPAGYTFVNLVKDANFNGSYTSASRLSDTVATVEAIVANSGSNGYYGITPSSGSTTIDKILPGMYLKVGSQDIFVDKVDTITGKFYAYFPSLPSAGNTIDAYQTTPDITATGVAIDETSSPITANLAFGGSPEDGFDSDDTIHLSLYIDTPGSISDIRLRLQAGGSTSDFYEKSLLPSPAQNVVEGATVVGDTARADTASDQYGKYQSTGVYGQIDNGQIQEDLSVNPYIPPPDNINTGLQPTSVVPAISGTWNEISVRKRDFLKVGRAGMSGYTWANISAVEIVVKPSNTADPITIKIGSIFAFGGSGLNSDRSQALQPYDYIYTYFDSDISSESNPSPIMMTGSGIRVSRQAINVQVRGFYNPDANPLYAGIDQIKVYRRGGAYSDGLFRFIGKIANPGTAASASEANTAIFEDSVDDISIINAPIAQFDNDPPVTSDLPYKVNSEINGVTDLGGGLYTISLSSYPFIFAAGPRSLPITILPSDNDTNVEIDTRIHTYDAPSLDINAYCQRAPVVGEFVQCEVATRNAGTTACVAFDRMWMDDFDNSGKLYSSKTGKPESWPTINDATQNAHVINVSSPDDPIRGLVEYGGELVVFTQNHIYTVRLDQGRIIGPFKTPSSRGLYTKDAFCVVDNEILFLAYDGIYSWGGGTCTKISLDIDPMFQGMNVNGIPPIDMTGTFGSLDAVSFFYIATKGNEVWFNFLNTDGYFNALRYHTIFKRWSLEEYYDTASTVQVTRNGYIMAVTSITAMIGEPTSGDIVACFSTTETLGTKASVAFLDKIDTDKVEDGVGIYYQATTKTWDLGKPLLQKQFTDIAVEVTPGIVSEVRQILCFYDYSSTALDSFYVTTTDTNRRAFQYPLGQTGSPSSSFGREARAMSIVILGQTIVQNTVWHNLSVTYINLADLQKGRILDWNDLGHPYDKRMNTVTIEYDVGASNVDLYLDYIYSKDGDTTNLAAQTFTLGQGVGTSRAKQTFPIIDGVVAKLVRLRPKVSTSQFQIFGDPEWNFEKYPPDIVNFTDYSDYGYKYEKRFYVLYLNVDTNGQTVTLDIEGDGSTKQTVTVSGTAANRMISKAINVDVIAKLVRLKVTNIPTGGKFQLFDHKFEQENLPPEIVYYTEWEDQGYNYNKYVEQITLDVNTNGQTVPVQIWGDGALKQTVNVNTTQSTRNINITLNPSMIYNIMRLVVDPNAIPVGGRFQLWSWKPIYQPADKGPVAHSYDWTDAGHPYDKKFVEMTFEYETSSDNVQIGIDTLTGIDGNTESVNVKTFTIVSAGRGKAVVPMIANSGAEIIAKMVRVHSNGTNGSGAQLPSFKMWNVQFPGYIPYPADKVPFTDWTDGGWACDKCFRGLGLEIDTGGVNCAVYLDVDGSAGVKSWTVNTTTSNRRVFLSADVSTEVIGKMFRIRLSPGFGGKAQLFGNPNWDLVRDACEFVFFDTFEQAFGSAGYTIIWQQWLDYKCDGGIRVRYYTDDGVLFYTKDLPAHLKRYPERFYLPSQYAGVNNKSKKHRITVEALDISKPFKLYRDESRTMVYNLSADQREGFYQNIIWENIKIEV